MLGTQFANIKVDAFYIAEGPTPRRPCWPRSGWLIGGALSVDMSKGKGAQDRWTERGDDGG